MIDSYYAPRFEIRITGLTLAADITNQVVSITYDNNLDMADMFSFVLRNANNQLLDSALFDLGKNVEIYMGYGDNLRPMMWGEITAIEPSFPESGALMLRVSGYDKSYRLRHNEPDRPPYRHMTDSMIAVQIAGEAGLIPVIDPSPIFHEEIQQIGSDMSFLQERARANFFRTYVSWDRLYFQFPRPQTEAYVLEWGKNLSSYTPRISSAALAGLQVVRGYNELLAQTIVGFAAATDFSPEILTEKLGSASLDLLRGLGRRLIYDQRLFSQRDALQLAQSVIQEILEGFYEGSGSCIGLPDLRAAHYITVQGVGKRFSGAYKLRRVTHTIDDGGYRTDFEVTQSSETSFLPLLRKTLVETPSPNKTERFYGVGVARVENNVDSEGRLGRVRVSYPWLSDTIQSGWARCTTLMSGADKGTYFLPEIGDEVLVAFEHGDPSSLIILGSLWNGKALPPAQNADGQNNLRLIKTRSGHTLTFDDTKEKEKILIRDKGGSQITLASDGSITINAMQNINLQATKGQVVIQVLDAQGKIIFQDKAGSEIALNGDGSVTVTATKDLTLQTTDGDVAITAAKGNIEMKAITVNVAVDNVMDVH